MKKTKSKAKKVVRRLPRQMRAHETVAAVLEAVVRILKRDGIEAVTTNRVADVAGVSVGTVYQYFADKRAIFAALHDRHSEQMGELVERTIFAYASAPLEELMRAIVDALVDAHAVDPELHELLASEVPHGARGAHAFEARLAAAFRIALAARREELPPATDLERLLFVVPVVVDALAHAAALSRPRTLSQAAAKEEAVQATLRCLMGLTGLTG